MISSLSTSCSLIAGFTEPPELFGQDRGFDNTLYLLENFIISDWPATLHFSPFSQVRPDSPGPGLDLASDYTQHSATRLECYL